MVVLWGIATWWAPLGSLLLLLRRRVAANVLLTSLVAMVLMTIHNYGFTNLREVTPGTGPLVFTGLIFIVSLLLWIYARAMWPPGRVEVTGSRRGNHWDLGPALASAADR